MSEKHLHRYIDEFATRHNGREFGTEGHLETCLPGTQGKYLPYEKLIR